MITLEQIRRARAKGKAQMSTLQRAPGISFLANQSYHFFQTAGGFPSAGAYGGAKAPIQFNGTKGAPSHAGGLILLNNAVAPEDNLLSLARLLNPSTNPQGLLWIVDLLVEYGGFSGTSAIAQSTGVATGTNNLPRNTDGEGVMMFADVSAALGATPATLNVTYTDQDGLTGTTQNVTTIASCAASKIAHLSGPFLPLAAGDRGVKSVQSAILSASTLAGTFAIVLCKPIAVLSSPLNLGVIEGDFSNFAPLLPPLPDDVALGFIWQPTTTNTPVFSGLIEALALNPDDPDA